MQQSKRSPSPLDWSALQDRRKPNTYLAAPPGFTPHRTDVDTPILDIEVNTLMRLWERMISKQPRITGKTISNDGLQIDYIQRTAVMRLPDQITIRFISRCNHTSTLAIYSHSIYGYWDFGVNKARVEHWLSSLQEEISAG